MDMKEFNALPSWKQLNLKKVVGLFWQTTPCVSPLNSCDDDKLLRVSVSLTSPSYICFVLWAVVFCKNKAYLDNSALHPSGVAKSSTSFGWGKGGKVTTVGWQVTLCDPIWHVISGSGEVILSANFCIQFTLLSLL